PVDIAARTGLGEEDYRALRGTPALRSASSRLAAAASRHLSLARARREKIARPALPALLPAIVAQGWLKRLRWAEYDPFDRAMIAPGPLQSWRLAAAALLKRF